MLDDATHRALADANRLQRFHCRECNMSWRHYTSAFGHWNATGHRVKGLGFMGRLLALIALLRPGAT